MKLEEQRIAIHQACGYQLTKTSIDTYWKKPNETLLLSDFMRGTATPDYLNDLNAMHEAEKMLRKPMKGSDTDTIIGDRMHKYAELIGYAFDATAAQRAEAFLRTLGLWTT